jgi:WD domain, G-beta repeat
MMRDLYASPESAQRKYIPVLLNDAPAETMPEEFRSTLRYRVKFSAVPDIDAERIRGLLEALVSDFPQQDYRQIIADVRTRLLAVPGLEKLVRKLVGQQAVTAVLPVSEPPSLSTSALGRRTGAVAPDARVQSDRRQPFEGSVVPERSEARRNEQAVASRAAGAHSGATPKEKSPARACGNSAVDWAAKPHQVLELSHRPPGLKTRIALSTQPERETLAGVRAVAFSPDRGKLATASADGKAHVWEVPSGRHLVHLGHEAFWGVQAIAFTPDGHEFVTASLTGASKAVACVWELSSRRQTAKVESSYALKVALSSDGRWLAIVRHTPTTLKGSLLCVWELPSGRQLPDLRSNSQIYGLAFDPYGRELATGGADSTARVWELSSGRQIAQFQHQNSVTAVAFSPNGLQLATGGADSTARAWELSSGRQIAQFQHQNSVTAVAFSPDGLQLATGSADYKARVWGPRR